MLPETANPCDLLHQSVDLHGDVALGMPTSSRYLQVVVWASARPHLAPPVAPAASTYVHGCGLLPGTRCALFLGSSGAPAAGAAACLVLR